MSPEERAAAREAIAEERSGAGTLRAELLGNGLEMALDALDAADKENEQLREALEWIVSYCEEADAAYGVLRTARAVLALYDKAPE